METNTQNLVIGLLGLALIVLILKDYNTEVIIAIISGLIGYLTNSKVDMDKLNNNITETIDSSLNESGDSGSGVAASGTSSDIEKLQTLVSDLKDLNNSGNKVEVDIDES